MTYANRKFDVAFRMTLYSPSTWKKEASKTIVNVEEWDTGLHGEKGYARRILMDRKLWNKKLYLSVKDILLNK
jgi:hypothetical protein